MKHIHSMAMPLFNVIYIGDRSCTLLKNFANIMLEHMTFGEWGGCVGMCALHPKKHLVEDTISSEWQLRLQLRFQRGVVWCVGRGHWPGHANRGKWESCDWRDCEQVGESVHSGTSFESLVIWRWASQTLIWPLSICIWQHRLWYFSVTHNICKGSKLDAQRSQSVTPANC